MANWAAMEGRMELTAPVAANVELVEVVVLKTPGRD
jgi:hypothetical protein